ncbi:MAG: hypothetical protein GKS03_14890 [Alphaproteobacteria bacterium]|nr:hypothetical protein [Alphaproteobacteria bacterium]
MDWENHFHKHGFALLPNAFNSEEIGQLSSAINAASGAPSSLTEEVERALVYVRDLPTEQRGPQEAENPSDDVYIIGALPHVDPIFHWLVCDSLLSNLAAKALATDSIHYHFSNATLKPPRVGPQVGWHRDYPNQYICGETSEQVRTLIFLNDTDTDNGGFYIIPGSHLVSDSEAKTQSPAMNDDESIALSCPAGSVLVLHPKLFHRSTFNRSERPRTVLLAQWGAANNPLVTSEVEWGTGQPPQFLGKMKT